MKQIILLLFFSGNAFAQIEHSQYPTRRMSLDTVPDFYFGTRVSDPYRWLENDTSADTREWVSEETELSNRYLGKLRRKYFPEKQLQLNSYASQGRIIKSGDYYFDHGKDREGGSAALYVKKKLRGDGVNAVDPWDYKNNDKDRPKISGFEVSDDNHFIAFLVSHNGSDWNEVRVKSMYPFRNCRDLIEDVKFSNIAWHKDGFFYERLPHTAGLSNVTDNPAIWYHKLGTSQGEDELIYGDPHHPRTRMWFDKIPGNCLVIYNSYIVDQKPETVVLTIDLAGSRGFKTDTIIQSGQDARFKITGVYKSKFLAFTTLGAANGKLILFNKHNRNRAEDFIPEFRQVLTQAAIVGDKIVCTYLSDVDYISITYDSSGKAVNEIDFPHGTSVDGFANSPDSMTIFYSSSFTNPAVNFEYNADNFKVSLVASTTIRYDNTELTMEKVFYFSRDSTKIPMILAYKKGLDRDKENPTILYGYGGNGAVVTPFFNRGFVSFMQNGGIVALPCLRGGGEYGEEWHDEGRLLNKQNVFDDYIAAAEYLFQHKYTRKSELCLMGGSNGGFLVAAVLNQRPDICKVAIIEKGILDMLRYQKFSIGYAWEKEYGSSDDSVQFNCLYKYSPLHNLKEVRYPAILVITADHDDRVVPAHSYKYVAALQKKNKSDNPVLLYIEKSSGHQSRSLETDANIYSFIYEQLGIPPSRIHNLDY